MKPASFEYHKPKTVEEAVALLAKYAPEDGRILAGGQSLVPTMAFRLARPAHLVDINGIASLKQIKLDGDVLCIGACARHADFHKPVCDGPLGHLLSVVVRDIAHYPIRMRGTFCGSVAHADPASEWCMVAATLDATMVAVSTNGERLIPAADFFETVMTTALAEDELLREVRIPALASDTKFGFEEFNRRAGDFGLAMALVTYRLDGGLMVDPHIGIGGAEDRPRRIADAEAALAGKAPGDDAFRAAANAAAAAIDPMEDHNTSAGYRRDLVATMIRRALEKAAK
jgi:carbon-monoxide dehydrogenase medium subunit